MRININPVRKLFSNGVKEVIKHWFTTYPWLKLISLILAILLWFYINGELRRYLL